MIHEESLGTFVIVLKFVLLLNENGSVTPTCLQPFLSYLPSSYMRDRVILITYFGPDTQEEAGFITSLLPSTVQDSCSLGNSHIVFLR